MPMNINLLPEYTDERYYVLSEIEQRANFFSIEELKDTKSIPNVGMNDFSAIYVLFDLRSNSNQSVSSLIQSIRDILSSINLKDADTGRYFLSIEVIINKPDSKSWEDCYAKKIIEDASNEIMSSFKFGLFGFGIADKSGATPALSAIMQWLQQIGSGIPQIAMLAQYGTLVKIGQVYVKDKEDFLGFAAHRGPDAESSVYQVWIVSRNPVELLSWTQNLINTTTKSFDTAEYKLRNRESIQQPVLLLACVAAVCAIAVYYIL